MGKLFGSDLSVVNVGLGSFADTIAGAGATVVDLDWAPPAGGDAAIGRALAGLLDRPDIEAANADAFARVLAARPVLEGLGRAGEVVPGMGARMILHAGPPIAWDDMCGPMRGGILGAILFEGWAADADSAAMLAASDEIDFAPCHHHAAVGPMAGVTSPSMPVWIVHNAEHGNRAYCNLNEGLGRVLRFGANDAEVIDRLNWMRDTLAPVLSATVEKLGGLDLKPLMAQALHMGDEVHNRNVAATSLFIRRLIPAALDAGLPAADLAEAMRFVAGNDHFFLNVSMAACKAIMDTGHGVANSTLVTAMARNGVEFGIRVSGAGETWFTTPAPVIEGLFFPGYGADDANPDLGDSTITETTGIGGFAMAAAPAIVQFVGGSPRDAVANTREMAHITLGRNPAFTLPQIDFAGTPSGIDLRRVVDTGILPVINTGIAHREAGIGQVGAGITRAPLACFVQAVAALSALGD